MLPDDGPHDVGLALIRRRVLPLDKAGIPRAVGDAAEILDADATDRRPSPLRAASFLHVFHPVRHRGGKEDASAPSPCIPSPWCAYRARLCLSVSYHALVVVVSWHDGEHTVA